MNKIIIIPFCLIIILGCFYLNNEKNINEDFLFAYIEAMASGETGEICLQGGSLKCGGSSGYSKYY